MKLSISNIAWEAKDDEQIYGMMKQMGFSGVEIAPTRWVSELPYSKVEEASAIAETLKSEYGFIVPSMQSIWFGKSERIFVDERERQELIDYTKKAIDYAAAIGCSNLVFGCPRNRNISEEWNLTEAQVEDIAVAFFKELGDYAAEKGTILGMEANPPIYNTNFVNTTKQALDLIKKVDSKGFLLNLDMGTMIHNGEDISLLKGNVSFINHVHISEPGLRPIMQREIHKELAEVLRKEGYNKYISIEMGKQEDVTIIEHAMRYVAEVFYD